MFPMRFPFSVVILVVLASLTLSVAADQTLGTDGLKITKSRELAINFLQTSQAEGGHWSSAEAPGITGLAIYALLVNGVPTTDAAVEKGLRLLSSYLQPDGGIYFPRSYHSNYETAICLLAFHAANKNGQYSAMIKNADEFLRKRQWDDSEMTDVSDPKYGGAGYGRGGDRPDLSNTVFFLEALLAGGAKQDDPAVQKALLFLSRCQNLETEHNTTVHASKVNDGGFFYTPAAGGNSQAGNTPNGGLRSYGSMTYAGLKSMIHAGLTADDPRVMAAVGWITQFYSVRENPGLDQQGLYYYYQMFAKALSAMGTDVVIDASGKSHNWRSELAEQLMSRQQENGAWVNKTDRWYEGNPDLATAYALIALHYCSEKLPH